jgi:hypothetical protein
VGSVNRGRITRGPTAGLGGPPVLADTRSSQGIEASMFSSVTITTRSEGKLLAILVMQMLLQSGSVE